MPADRPSTLKLIRELAGAEPVLLGEMTWPEVANLQAGGGDVCILPIGATEQHGAHLPLNTDTLFAEAVCQYASARTRVPVLPAISYGCSLGHTDRWPGTVSLFPETLIATLREIAGFLIRTHWKRLLIVNSHWGNTSSIRCAIDRVRFENFDRFQIGLRNSFELTKSIWSQFIDDGEDFHANRAETALMLFLAPHLVRTDRIIDDPDRTPGKVFTYTVPQTSKHGLTGAPSLATADDGRRLFLEMGEALTDLVRRAAIESAPLE